MFSVQNSLIFLHLEPHSTYSYQIQLDLPNLRLVEPWPQHSWLGIQVIKRMYHKENPVARAEPLQRGNCYLSPGRLLIPCVLAEFSSQFLSFIQLHCDSFVLTHLTSCVCTFPNWNADFVFLCQIQHWWKSDVFNVAHYGVELRLFSHSSTEEEMWVLKNNSKNL